MDSDKGLAANDPYRQMDSGEEGVQPDFLKNKSGAAQGVLGAAEQAANLALAAKGGKVPAKGGGAAGSAGGGTVGGLNAAGGSGGGAKKGIEDGLKSGASSAEKAEAGEKSPRGLYNGGKDARGSKSKDDEEPSLKMSAGMKAALPLVMVFMSMFGVLILILALPVMMIGAIDYNLQKSLGFVGTIGILEKIGEFVTSELLSNGEMPTKYASDLAANGMLVGQVTENGDFIRTDTYIANIDERDDLVAAAGGFSYVSDKEGELALLYNGNVIRADEFVAAVEADPKLYAEYSEAADISVKYYYGKDVSKVYKDMKISRGSFNDWEATGDYKTDEASFKKILDEVLDGSTSSKLGVGGVHDDTLASKISSWIASLPIWGFSGGTGGTFLETVTDLESADKITEKVSDETKEYIDSWKDAVHTVPYACKDDKGNDATCYKDVTYREAVLSDNATERAAELLNTAVSSKEPYTASNAFIGIEEPIQRARIGDNGPVNQLMNTLSKPTSVSYKDVKTGNNVTKKASIFETANFQAAVGDRKYSADEAASFARDRVLEVTNKADKEIIKGATISSNGLKKSTTAVRNGASNNKANKDTISKANDSVDMAIIKKNSELFESVVGGNRILEGGSFLSNNINKKVIGAMPSDSDTVAAYQVELNEVIARKEAADRASRSPFDVSSPNTFLGSIVHNFATSMLGSYGGGFSALTAIRATGATTGNAVSSLLGTATAQGADQHYTSFSPDNCATVGTIKVEGDLYCTSHNTVNTDYKHYTMEDWKKSAIGSSLDDDGKIKEDSDLEKFVIMGMDRESTVGTGSAEVCQAWHKYNDGWLDKIKHFFSNIVGLYEVCKGVDEKIVDGREYSFTSGHNSDLGLYSGYMLYNQVYSLLSGKDSAVALAREDYYARNPRDDSEAGEIARISGMTKSEAELALAYADYLTYIANYDASDRYAFGMLDLGLEKPILVEHSDNVMESLYAWHREEIEYKDARNREVATA